LKFPTKTLYARLFLICLLHVSPIAFLSFWSPELNFMRITNHLARHYVIFAIPLLPHPFYAQIFPSTPYFLTPSTYVPPQCEQPSFTPIQNNRQNCTSAYFNLDIFG
jgi:hypothetical protein